MHYILQWHKKETCHCHVLCPHRLFSVPRLSSTFSYYKKEHRLPTGEIQRRETLLSLLVLSSDQRGRKRGEVYKISIVQYGCGRSVSVVDVGVSDWNLCFRGRCPSCPRTLFNGYRGFTVSDRVTFKINNYPSFMCVLCIGNWFSEILTILDQWCTSYVMFRDYRFTTKSLNTGFTKCFSTGS